MKQRLLTTTLLITALVTIVSPVANAVTSAGQPTNASGQALEIAPPYLNLKANPGETIQTKLSVRDVSTQSLYVTNEVNDFTANGEDGTPKIIMDTNEPNPYSIINWLQPIAPLTLKPKQIENIPITINVPANAAPGGYYGVVRFTATPPDIDQSGVSLSASLGAMIFIRVNGDAKEKLSIESFGTSKDGSSSWLYDSIPVDFVARIKNEGNVHEQPVGQIEVKDLFGNIIVAVNINLEQRNVLPGTVRKFETVLDKTGVGDRFLIGPYSAKLTMKYGADNSHFQTITATSTFWIFPWKMLLTAIVVLIILVLVVRMLIKRYNDRLLGGRSNRSRRR